MDMPPRESTIPLCSSIADCNYVYVVFVILIRLYEMQLRLGLYSFPLKVISLLALKGFRLRAMHYHTNLLPENCAGVLHTMACQAQCKTIGS